jgi:type IV pilus assembly protein PilB
MLMTDEIRKMTIERRSADEITEAAVREGMHRLRDDGLAKVKLGRTSIAEVARVTGSL